MEMDNMDEVDTMDSVDTMTDVEPGALARVFGGIS